MGSSARREGSLRSSHLPTRLLLRQEEQVLTVCSRYNVIGWENVHSMWCQPVPGHIRSCVLQRMPRFVTRFSSMFCICCWTLFFGVSGGASLKYVGASSREECFATLRHQPTFAPDACVYWKSDVTYTQNVFHVSECILLIFA